MKQSDFVAAARQIEDKIISWRRQIHQNPELSGQEKDTAALVARILRENGYEVQEGVGGFGVVGTLRGAFPGKVVAFRADMDALSIAEQTGAPYASVKDGVMHACGHDVHTAALLGAAVLLAQTKDAMAGGVRLIFQPKEELSPQGGSRDMIRAGVLDGVEQIFALHVWPDLPHGTIGVRAGEMMAASDRFTIRLHGRSCHASQPERGIDALWLGAQVVEEIRNILRRAQIPRDKAVVSVGKMQAGNRYNIIAEECVLEGTCRTVGTQTRLVIEEQLGQIVDEVCRAAGARGELEYLYGYCAVQNDEASAVLVRQSAADLFGEEAAVWLEQAVLGSEDFAFFLRERSGAYFFLGTGMGERAAALHNSGFNVDEDILWRASAMIAQLLMNATK